MGRSSRARFRLKTSSGKKKKKIVILSRLKTSRVNRVVCWIGSTHLLNIYIHIYMYLQLGKSCSKLPCVKYIIWFEFTTHIKKELMLTN